MTKITKTSDRYIDLVVHFECRGNVNLYLDAYLDDVGVWTIGIGSTKYEDGTKVKKGDKITKERAYQLFRNTISFYESNVDGLCVDSLNQNQFDALVDFAYNCGVGALKQSTVLKLVNKGETKLENLEKWFVAWNKGKYKDHKDNDGDGLIDEEGELAPLLGLTRRRKCEALLYCTGEINYFENLKA